MAFAEGTTTEQGKQPYKYGGKELDQSHGLNQYDYSARYYDPGYGRFTTGDRLSEKYYNISPYAYVGNNPLKFIDPDGRSYTDYVNKDGVRRVKTNDETPDRIETSLPEVKVEGKAIQKEGNGIVAVGVSIIKESQAGASTAGIPVNINPTLIHGYFVSLVYGKRRFQEG